MEIELASKSIELDAVVIVEEIDPAILLMRKVIANISKNYMQDCYSQKALIRESLFIQSQDSLPLYLLEGTTEDQIRPKSSGIKKHTNLLTSRFYESKSYKKYQDLNLAGSSTLFENFNFIYNNSGPFNKSKFEKNYKFSIIDTLVINDTEFIELGFKTDKKIEFGRIFINPENFAVQQFALYRKRKPSKLAISDYKTTSMALHIRYSKIDSLYFTQSIELSQSYEPNNEDLLISKFHFHVLKFDNCGQAFNPHLQIYDNDILYDVFKDRIDAWTPSDVPDKKMETYNYLFAESSNPASLPETKRAKPIFYLGYSLLFYTSKNPETGISYSHSQLTIADTIARGTSVNITIATTLGFQLTQHLQTELELFGSIDFRTFSGTFLKLIYTTSPFKQGSFSLGIGLQTGFLEQRIFIGKFSHQETIRINNKTFDSGSLDVFFEQRSFQMSPTLILNYSVNNRTSLQLTGVHFIPLSMRRGLYFKENDSFLKRKITFTSRNIHYNGAASLPTTFLSFSPYVSLGFKTTF